MKKYRKSQVWVAIEIIEKPETSIGLWAFKLGRDLGVEANGAQNTDQTG
jgi:hypothetical protein